MQASASLRRHMPLDSSSESETDFDAGSEREVASVRPHNERDDFQRSEQQRETEKQRQQQLREQQKHWAGVDDDDVRLWQDDDDDVVPGSEAKEKRTIVSQRALNDSVRSDLAPHSVLVPLSSIMYMVCSACDQGACLPLLLTFFLVLLIFD